MYLSILLFPFLGALFSGLLGRKLGVSGSQLVSCLSLLLSAILSSIAFYNIGLLNNPVSITLGSWIDSELMTVSWEFMFDQVAVVFCIMITYITFLILVYTVYYMEGNPHNQRFFSYLSAFAGFMLILVTGANYFVLFVGWEGKLNCLRWVLEIASLISKTYKVKEGVYFYDLGALANISVALGSFMKLSSLKRIGPHNQDVISLIIGSILGDTHLEKRKKGLGTRIIFEQSSNNVEYLMWFHKFLSDRGYCNSKKPKLIRRIRKNNTVTFQYRVSSFTFYSFNWLHEMFYTLENGRYIKKIPNNLSEFLTPLALAIWFMDDGSKINKTIRIATNSFLYEEIIFLCAILKKKYSIIATVQSGGKNKGYILYVSTKSTDLFIKIVKPHMIPSMYYKLGDKFSP